MGLALCVPLLMLFPPVLRFLVSRQELERALRSMLDGPRAVVVRRDGEPPWASGRPLAGIGAAVCSEEEGSSSSAGTTAPSFLPRHFQTGRRRRLRRNMPGLMAEIGEKARGPAPFCNPFQCPALIEIGGENDACRRAGGALPRSLSRRAPLASPVRGPSSGGRP